MSSLTLNTGTGFKLNASLVHTVIRVNKGSRWMACQVEGQLRTKERRVQLALAQPNRLNIDKCIKAVSSAQGWSTFRWCGDPWSMVQKHILFKQSQWQPNSLLVACKKPSNDAYQGSDLPSCTRRLPCVQWESRGKKQSCFHRITVLMKPQQHPNI